MRPPSQPDNLADLAARQTRFERTVATCLCTVPLLFGAQCLLVALAIPIFKDMFADFGSALPAFTLVVFSTRIVWIVVSVGLPAFALFTARKGNPAHAVVFATIAGILLFFIAQTVTVAMLTPVFQMAGVVGSGQ